MVAVSAVTKAAKKAGPVLPIALLVGGGIIAFAIVRKLGGVFDGIGGALSGKVEEADEEVDDLQNPNTGFDPSNLAHKFLEPRAGSVVEFASPVASTIPVKLKIAHKGPQPVTGRLTFFVTNVGELGGVKEWATDVGNVTLPANGKPLVVTRNVTAQVGLASSAQAAISAEFGGVDLGGVPFEID